MKLVDELPAESLGGVRLVRATQGVDHGKELLIARARQCRPQRVVLALRIPCHRVKLVVDLFAPEPMQVFKELQEASRQLDGDRQLLKREHALLKGGARAPQRERVQPQVRSDIPPRLVGEPAHPVDLVQETRWDLRVQHAA